MWPWASHFLSPTSVFLSVKWGRWTWSASRPDVAGKDVVGGTENSAVFQNKVPMLTGWWLGSKSPDLASKNTGYSVQFEFHIYNKYYYFFCISVFHVIFGISLHPKKYLLYICFLLYICCICFLVSDCMGLEKYLSECLVFYLATLPQRYIVLSIPLAKTEPNEQQQEKTWLTFWYC